MAQFESVVDHYATGRPGYPRSVFDALEPLGGSLVAEGGAGTGLATRHLVDRGAIVVAVDPGRNMLNQAAALFPRPLAVQADAARLPLPDASIELACFAQSWHWLDPERRVAEIRRVLRPGGRWAGWWNHARSDHEPWFEAYWSLVETSCPGVSRTLRDVDWSADFGADPGFTDPVAHRIHWQRRLTIDTWHHELQSLSYIGAMADEPRAALLAELVNLARQRFPDGAMTLAFRTDLWVVGRTVY